MTERSERLLVIINAATGLLLLVVAVVAASVGAALPRTLLPAVASFGAGGAEPVRVTLAQVDLVPAVIVVLAFLSVLRFGACRPAWREAWLRGVGGDRHGLRWIELSQVGGVTVFLLAQLNGVSEIAALVPLYAMAASAPLLLVLHDRRTVRGRAGLLAYSFGTAIAIVPWGVIAFAQIGGGLAAAAPSAGVRVLTIVMLLLVASIWAAAWRTSQRPGTAADAAARAEVTYLALLTAVPLLLAALSLAMVATA